MFGEVLPDVCENFEPFTYSTRLVKPGVASRGIYRGGQLSVPCPTHAKYAYHSFVIFIPNRRLRFYLFLSSFENVTARSVTSALPYSRPLSLDGPLSDQLGLSVSDRDLLRKIDQVALRTLDNCMQTVYEDGPRRDRRLWIGDIRLQSITNYATFRDIRLAKRCYYLLAALPVDDEGRISACIFERPQPVDGGDQIAYCSQIVCTNLSSFLVTWKLVETYTL
ncbi:glycoside hydrolase family 78 protein [Ramaria rubella]|nr:glycoside hydrolase family 78 protein [Ramaria rubella]